MKNTGNVDGIETAQVYYRRTADKEGPQKTLCAYQQVSLKAGESRTVSISLPKKQLESWDAQSNTMRFQRGEYMFMVGPSSADSDVQKVGVTL
jgi:beta-glucosidase